MSVPTFQDLMLPLLEQGAVKATPVREAVGLMADLFELTDDERNELLPKKSQTRIANRTNWAVSYLVRAGLLERPQRAWFQITDAGRSLLASSPKSIDVKFLNEHYETFENRSVRDEAGSSSAIEEVRSNVEDSTPQEKIEIAQGEIESALQGDILEQVAGLEPSAFEQLIVDLMMGMGYGEGGDGRRIGQAGDGGIDGIISEDKLGLDVVYLQAKRYAPENAIGPEQVRGFIGALSIRRATKGVFVTTSRFTSAAQEEAKMSGQRVILINGKRLAELMIHYGVGVRVTNTVLIKEIDLNYFDDF